MEWDCCPCSTTKTSWRTPSAFAQTSLATHGQVCAGSFLVSLRPVRHASEGLASLVGVGTIWSSWHLLCWRSALLDVAGFGGWGDSTGCHDVPHVAAGLALHSCSLPSQRWVRKVGVRLTSCSLGPLRCPWSSPLCQPSSLVWLRHSGRRIRWLVISCVVRLSACYSFLARV